MKYETVVDSNVDKEEAIVAKYKDANNAPTDLIERKSLVDPNEYKDKRGKQYLGILELVAAYTEKEIGGSSTKWDDYVIKYNKVRTDNPK